MTKSFFLPGLFWRQRPNFKYLWCRLWAKIHILRKSKNVPLAIIVGVPLAIIVGSFLLPFIIPAHIFPFLLHNVALPP